MAEHHTKETDTLGDETPNDEVSSYSCVLHYFTKERVTVKILKMSI